MFRLVGCSFLCLPVSCVRLLVLARNEARRKGEQLMRTLPVAGVDISKRFSDMCILTPENEIFERLKIYHDITSMELARAALQKAAQTFGKAPVIVMESTSH